MPHPGKKHWLRRYDWDAIAGIVAAATALILHLLHVVQPDILLTITLVLVALLLLRQLRHEEREERVEEAAGRTEQMIVKLHEVLKAPEVVLADHDADGQAEAQLSFWGEPFMARTTGCDVPRYIFHVHAHSELVPQLVELARSYRMAP